jgi:hypothetical protein
MSAERSSNALAVQVERRIFLARGQKVMLDFDLAELYGVETRALKQAVRRNLPLPCGLHVRTLSV